MTKKPNKTRGRPTRKVASKKALSGVNVRTIDPVSILQSIAADDSAPASARVAACKALIVADVARGKSPQDDNSGGDAVSRHALRILQGGKK